MVSYEMAKVMPLLHPWPRGHQTHQLAQALVFLPPFPICSLLGFVLWKAFAYSFLPSLVLSFLTKVDYPPAVYQIPGHRGTKQKETMSALKEVTV